MLKYFLLERVDKDGKRVEQKIRKEILKANVVNSSSFSSLWGNGVIKKEYNYVLYDLENKKKVVVTEKELLDFNKNEIEILGVTIEAERIKDIIPLKDSNTQLYLNLTETKIFFQVMGDGNFFVDTRRGYSLPDNYYMENLPEEIMNLRCYYFKLDDVNQIVKDRNSIKRKLLGLPVFEYFAGVVLTEKYICVMFRVKQPKLVNKELYREVFSLVDNSNYEIEVGDECVLFYFKLSAGRDLFYKEGILKDYLTYVEKLHKKGYVSLG